MEPFNWICPYCHRTSTIVAATNYYTDTQFYESFSKDGFIGLVTQIIVCPNPDCREYTISAGLYSAYVDAFREERIDDKKRILSWSLKPQSSAIPQPEYIPKQIRSDYNEACSILSLSPKASATLARRCLQGMIRNFWGITKGRLIDEINELKNQGKVNSSTMDSIDAVRQLGNIGAHMESDVNLIIDIDEGEANILIKLLEDLFQDWYIDRHEREERNKKLQEIAAAKQTAKTGT